jgi:hypothetical protein
MSRVRQNDKMNGESVNISVVSRPSIGYRHTGRPISTQIITTQSAHKVHNILARLQTSLLTRNLYGRIVCPCMVPRLPYDHQDRAEVDEVQRTNSRRWSIAPSVAGSEQTPGIDAGFPLVKEETDSSQPLEGIFLVGATPAWADGCLYAL